MKQDNIDNLQIIVNTAQYVIYIRNEILSNCILWNSFKKLNFIIQILI